MQSSGNKRFINDGGVLHTWDMPAMCVRFTLIDFVLVVMRMMCLLVNDSDDGSVRMWQGVISR